MLGLAAISLVVVHGCGSDAMQGVICYAQSDIFLRFPGGASTIGTVTASGGCSIDGPPIACEPVDPACDAGSCACDVVVRLAQTTAVDCRLDVTSASGATFDVDVPLTISVGPCGGPEAVVPANDFQWSITADFSTDAGVTDAGVTDGSTGGRVTDGSTGGSPG